jgi:peptidoglycan biosynthesis/recognition FemAB-like protein
MIRWELISEERAQAIWDATLTSFDDCSPFQSYAWAQYRRCLGWQPHRWIAFDEHDAPVAMMQGYVRRYPLGVGLGWSEGGPVGDLSACDKAFHQAVKETTRLRHVYYRFRCDRPRNIEDSLRLTSQGWAMPWSPLTTNYTMTIDLNVTEEKLLKSCERNWRWNLKKSNECDLRLSQWLHPSAEEIVAAYRSMENVKGLEEQLSETEIEQMLKSVRPHLVAFRCDDASGELVCVMGCLVTGDKACLVLSATAARGRELRASYATFWSLIRHLRNIGVQKFDFAGIDPVRNPGVYRFKRAAGGTPIEMLGEWDWASRPSLRWFGNWAIAKRNRIRQAETALNRSRKTEAAPPKEVELRADTGQQPRLIERPIPLASVEDAAA